MSDADGGPDRTGPGVSARLVAACALLLRVLYGGVALLGLLVTPPGLLLLVAPGAGLAAAVVVAGLLRYLEGSWPCRQVLSASGLVAAAALPFGSAVVVLGPVGPSVVFVLMLLLTVTLVGGIDAAPVAPGLPSGALPPDVAPPDPQPSDGAPSDARPADPQPADLRRPGPRPPGAAPRETVGDAGTLAQLLRVLPLQALCDEWRSTGQPRRGRGSRAPDPAVVQLRTLLLEEMARRDPTGFSRWLQEGPDTPPERYLRDDQGQGLAA